MRPEPNGSGKLALAGKEVVFALRFNEAGAEWLRKTFGLYNNRQFQILASMRPEPNGSGKRTAYVDWLNYNESFNEAGAEWLRKTLIHSNTTCLFPMLQ